MTTHSCPFTINISACPLPGQRFLKKRLNNKHKKIKSSTNNMERYTTQRIFLDELNKRCMVLFRCFPYCPHCPCTLYSLDAFWSCMCVCVCVAFAFTALHWSQFYSRSVGLWSCKYFSNIDKVIFFPPLSNIFLLNFQSGPESLRALCPAQEAAVHGYVQQAALPVVNRPATGLACSVLHFVCFSWRLAPTF